MSQAQAIGLIGQRSAIQLMAEKLQQQGFTISEIAEQLDCRREYIANLLYWEKVRT